MHWFTRSWWDYLLTGRVRIGSRSYGRPRYGWVRFWCRLKGHPDGVWFYNVGGLEPDMHCRNCGDDLG